VLDALEEIKVCVGYELNGKKCDSLPSVSHELRRVAPVYETLPGWKSPTVGVTDLSDLPRAAREYVNFLSNQIGVQIGLISTGPERSQTIIVRESVLAEWLR
jgi:adenylosuccinate synthase